MTRSRIVWVVAVVLVAVGVWFLVPRDPATPSVASTAVPNGSTSAASTSPAPEGPSPSPTRASRSSCRVGEPRRLQIPALEVDAPFERIGLDQQAEPDANGRLPLGNPTDRTQAGWYAVGPRPGSGSGTVLTNGHTYRNGSAIFREDFARRIALRQLITIKQDNGSVCSYRVTKV